MIFKKQTIAPGTYWTKDGPVTFTANDVDGMFATGKAMLGAGLSIPVPLEHQDTAKPQTTAERKARSVLFNTGWVKDYEKNSDGSVSTVYELDPEEINKTCVGSDGKPMTNAVELSKKLPTTIKNVSPEILPEFRDGTGRVWKNVISHVALTHKPVWASQKPFGDDGTKQFALPEGKSFCLWSDKPFPISLSLTDRVEPTAVRLAKDFPMADDKEPAGDEPAADAPPDAAAPIPEPQAVAPDPGMQQLRPLLEAMGIHLPADTDTKNIVERLIVACHALNKGDGTKPKEGPAGELGGEMDSEPITKEPVNVAMSLQDRVWYLEKELAEERFKGMGMVIDDLCTAGQISPDDQKTWKEALGGKRLSLAVGNDISIREILANIEFAKKIPKGAFWDSERRAVEKKEAEVPERPAHARLSREEELTESRIKDLTDELYGKRNGST